MDTLFDTAGRALGEIIFKNRYLDQVTSYWIAENRTWTPYEKYLFADLVEETTRWWRLLNELRIPGLPRYGSQTHEIVAIYLAIHPHGLPIESRISPKTKQRVLEKLENLSAVRPLAESIPDWLDEICFNELGNRWPAELKALNQRPPIVLRTNLIKTNTNELIAWLKREGYQVKRLSNSDAILLTEPANIFRSEAFRLGMFEQQDFSSQQVVPFMKIQPGERIIDACAGNGGKTLHMASLLGNKGKIVAMDTVPWKLQELKRRARRAGVTNVEIKLIDSAKTIKRLHDSADRVLIDAPCSGLGVLKRNPDAKWKLKPETIQELKQTQRQILKKYWPMVKPGGYLVYATCSILPSENEQQVEWFINEMNGQFSLEEEKHISPAQSGFDGFYMARMKRES